MRNRPLSKNEFRVLADLFSHPLTQQTLKNDELTFEQFISMDVPDLYELAEGLIKMEKRMSRKQYRRTIDTVVVLSFIELLDTIHNKRLSMLN